MTMARQSGTLPILRDAALRAAPQDEAESFDLILRSAKGRVSKVGPRHVE
jgi:hypothetical protein